MAWLRRVTGILGTYGTLVALGLLPIPATLIAVIAGAITEELLLAITVALFVSVAVNVGLVYYVWRGPGKRWRTRRPPPSTAYSVPGDLGTLVLTSQDFEDWWTVAVDAARKAVGPDVLADVGSIHFGAVSAFMAVYGESAVALKRFDLHVDGALPGNVVIHAILRNRKATANWQPQEPLWRSDGSWRNLVEQAWLREGPRDLDRTLCFLSAKIDDRNARYWRITFQDYDADDDSLDRRAYRFVDGRLTRDVNEWK
jgi:hypothetical protein